MKKILFVDDESRILQGLRRMLRPLRREWDMHFAEGGRAALELLSNDTFDVIVTDMRMPGMDGIELLTHCKQKHPEMIRIVLSGHVDPDMGVRSVAVAHQFLHKPCDAELLRHVVARSGELQDLLGDQALKALIGDTSTLPVLPHTYRRLTEALENADVSFEAVASIIESSPVVAARVLQLVNSAFVGVNREVSDLVQAIRLLGLNVLRDLVLLQELVHCIDTSQLPRSFSPAQFEHHAHAVSSLARRLMPDKVQSSIAFTAGILHDIGELILALRRAEAYDELCRTALEEGRPREDVEYERFGFSHAEIGGYLLGLWGLPHPVIEAVAYHHRPSRLPTRAVDAVTAVHVADTLVHELDADGRVRAPVRLDEDYLDGILDEDQRKAWHAQAESLLAPTQAGVTP